MTRPSRQATASGVVSVSGILGESAEDLVVTSTLQDLRLQWVTFTPEIPTHHLRAEFRRMDAE